MRQRSGPSLREVMARLQRLPQAREQAAQVAAPAVRQLLHLGAEGGIRRAAPPAGPRRFRLTAVEQARVDGATSVQPTAIGVRVGSTSTNPNVRPLVPVGTVPARWRRDIGMPLRDVVREILSGGGRVTVVG